MDFGSRLKKYRKLQSLTQKQLGNKLGLSESTISLYESNQRFPNRVVLSSLANLFNISFDDLLSSLPLQQMEEFQLSKSSFSCRLGATLRQLREDSKLTQSFICETLHIAQSTLANYEAGFRSLSLEMLTKFSKFYGVSLDFLVGNATTSKEHLIVNLDNVLNEEKLTFQNQIYEISNTDRNILIQSLEVAFYGIRKKTLSKKDTSNKGD